MKKILILLALASCTSTDGVSYITGFSPPGSLDGYTRFVTPTITELKPGQDLMFCQWVEAPQDADRQIVERDG